MEANSQIQVHIMPAPINLDQPPTIVFGFAGTEFSQAVYLTAPEDPTEALRNADVIYKSYVEACGAAVKAWRDAEKEPSDDAKS
jgi:hypothetical protein